MSEAKDHVRAARELADEARRHADEAKGYLERLWAINAAAIKHESETPMRGHDEDGACCRRAMLEALEADQ